jgi:predicted  nucleic acid-binding Zn-ribbon protein
MAVFACTSCGWVRRSEAQVMEARCPDCGEAVRALTPQGSLAGRAAAAAATAKALHDPAVRPFPGTTHPSERPVA